MSTEARVALEAIGGIAAAATVIVGLAGVASAWTRRPRVRRSIWQAAVLALLAAGVGEWAGWRSFGVGGAVGERVESVGMPARSGQADIVGGTTDVAALAPEVEGGEAGGTSAVPRVSESAATTRGGGASEVAFWIAVAWIAGAACVALRALGGALLLGWRRRRWLPATDAGVLERVARLSARMGLRRPPSTRVARGLLSPLTCGVWRPGIVLPPGFGDRFSPSQQDAILAHELAHVEGRDALWFALADAAAALMWWHPLAWWARRQLQQASEFAADEASAVLETGPVELAASLVELGKRMTATGWLARLGVEGGGFRSGLGRRVERLLETRGLVWRPSRPGRGLLANVSLGATFALAGLMATARVPSGGGLWAAALGPANSGATVEPTGEASPSLVVTTRGAAPEELATRPDSAVIEFAAYFLELDDAAARTAGLEWLLNFDDAPASAVRTQIRTAEPGEPGQLGEIRTEYEARQLTSGILTEAQMEAALNILQRQPGVKTLAAPRVSTLSGGEAMVQVSDKRSVVTGYDTNTMTYVTTPVDVGPEFRALPTLEENGFTLQVQFSAAMREFLGYDDPRNRPAPVIGQVTYQLPLPRIQVRAFGESTVRVWDGQAIVARIGKAGMGETGRHLVVFVKSTIRDRSGNRVWQPGTELPFDPRRFPSQSGASPRMSARALEDALRRQERLVELGEQELAAMREAGGLRESSASWSDEAVGRLEAIDVDLRVRIGRAEARIEKVRNLSRAELRNVLPTLVPEERLLVEMMSRANEAKHQLASLKANFGDQHPETRAAESRLEKLEAMIDERVAGMILGMETELEALRTERATIERELAVLAACRAKAKQVENARVMADVMRRKLAQEILDAR